MNILDCLKNHFYVVDPTRLTQITGIGSEGTFDAKVYDRRSGVFIRDAVYDIGVFVSINPEVIDPNMARMSIPDSQHTDLGRAAEEIAESALRRVFLETNLSPLG